MTVLLYALEKNGQRDFTVRVKMSTFFSGLLSRQCGTHFCQTDRVLCEQSSVRLMTGAYLLPTHTMKKKKKTKKNKKKKKNSGYVRCALSK